MAPKPAQAITAAMNMPPRHRPIMARVYRNSALTGRRVANCPISRNSGTTDKSYTE